MSIVDQIKALEELAAIDAEIRSLDDQITKERAQLSTSRAALAKLDEKLAQSRATLAGLDKQRSDSLIEVRNMNQQLEHSREKLNRSRTERESNAAQREIEELRKLHRDREEELERLTTASDSARAAIEEADGKRVQLTSSLEGSQQGITSAIADLETERTQRMEARAQVVAKLPVALYRRYESIRARRPVAIAKTHDGTCLGCHMSIPPMMFQNMRRREEFEQCPQCRRILYYVPPEEARQEPPRS